MNDLPQTLEHWLAHCERVHPRSIEMGLERVSEVSQRLGLRFESVVITVAGTNGKGSTCAFMESILLSSGWRVGVYSSPHLVRFEERCRVQGVAVAADALLAHFEAVESARGDLALTYFEFTTLVIMSFLSQAGLDAVILEVGLGGRLDAVNVVDADCAVITSIDLDHMEYLGPDRESIGREKAGILRPGRPVVISDPRPPASLLECADQIGADVRLIGRDFGYAAQQGEQGRWQQWSWSGRAQRYGGLAYPALRGTNQLINASGALAALECLRHRLPVSAQSVREGLARVELPGRFQIVPGEPILVLDVAHNPHAVSALAANLDQMGYYPCTRVVFGAMADKDLAAMVERLIGLVDHWYLCDLPTPRAASASTLSAVVADAEQVARSQGRALPSTVARSTCVGPAEALASAVSDSDPTDRILVFGSFFTVGGVLAAGLPRLSARHMGAPDAPSGR